MNVRIKLFSYLAKLLPPGSQNNTAEIIIEEGVTVEDMLNMLNVPNDTTNVVLVNRKYQDRKTMLKEGDTVTVFPPITGG
ncbi:MAG: MoaD/ThiS family protein [bacterium]